MISLKKMQYACKKDDSTRNSPSIMQITTIVDESYQIGDTVVSK